MSFNASPQLGNSVDLDLVNFLRQNRPKILNGIHVGTVRRPGREKLNLLLQEVSLCLSGCVTGRSILLQSPVIRIWEELRRQDVVRDSSPFLEVTGEWTQHFLCVKKLD